MTDTAEFDQWFVWLLRLMQHRAVSVSEAERLVRMEAPPFDGRYLLAVVEGLLGRFPMAELETRFRLARLALAGAERPGGDKDALARARELAVVCAIDILVERHDGLVFSAASAVAQDFIGASEAGDDVERRWRGSMLAGLVRLEPFAPDFSYGNVSLGLALREQRQRWVNGFGTSDRLPGAMPTCADSLAAAEVHFTAAADLANGADRAIALAYLAFVHFARFLYGGAAVYETSRDLAAEAIASLTPAYEPLAYNRGQKILNHRDRSAGSAPFVALLPIAAMVPYLGVQGAVAAQLLAIDLAGSTVPVAKLSDLAAVALSALPEDGLEQAKVRWRMHLGHHLLGDPTTCEDHVRGVNWKRVARAARRKPAVIAAGRVHALYHQTHYDYQALKPAVELVESSADDLAQPLHLIRAVLAINAASQSLETNRIRAAREFAIASLDFLGLGHLVWAMHSLEMMHDQLRREEPAVVGTDFAHAASGIVLLADAVIADLGEAGWKALQECLGMFVRGIVALQSAASLDHLLLVSQLVKARAFTCAAGVPEALMTTAAQTELLQEIDGETRKLSLSGGIGNPFNEILDVFGVRLVSFVSQAESAPGSSPEEVLANLKIEYQRLETRTLYGATVYSGGETIRRDAVQAFLPSGTLFLSLYYGEITRESGFGVLVQVLTRHGGPIIGLSSPEGEWLDRAIVMEHADLGESGIGRRELSTFSLSIGRLLLALREDPLHRQLSRHAEERLRDMVDWFAPLLKWLERSTQAQSYSHICIWPHQATYFLPWALLPFREGILADYFAITLAPSLFHQPYPRRPDAVRPGAPVPVLAVGCADGGARYGLQTESSLESVATMIGSLFGQEALVGAAATPAKVLAQAQHSELIHIGAHGMQDLSAPTFHCVFLAPGESGEGRLFAHQIVGLDLRHVRLVTLSACESSLIRFDYNDNIVGLSSAFLLAGAAAVVGALWPVTSPVASIFFGTLYGRLTDGAATLRAFRAAQQQTRSEFPQYRDWGAFCLLGRAEEETDVARR